LAYSKASRPLLFLPPWVNISHLSPFFFASIATTIHCEPNFFELSKTTFGFSTAAVLIDTLSAPQFNNLFISFILLTPPPTVKGTKFFFDVLYEVQIFLLNDHNIFCLKHYHILK